jgi:hypothetical protein
MIGALLKFSGHVAGKAVVEAAKQPAVQRAVRQAAVDLFQRTESAVCHALPNAKPWFGRFGEWLPQALSHFPLATQLKSLFQKFA